VPVALASLGLGPRAPLVGFFKSSSARFQNQDRQIEAQKKRGAKSRRGVAKRSRFLPSQAPSNQRGICGHRVLLNAKGRLANALGPGDGPEARRLRAIE
jgi:hypothetical protein